MIGFAAELCIYILTWNIGYQTPKNNNLPMSNALSLNIIASTCPFGKPPDVFVVGLQNVPRNEKPWLKEINKHLPSKSYHKIATKRTFDTVILMYAQKDTKKHIDHIEMVESPIGFGVVSIRMSLYGVGVTFICLHLLNNEINTADTRYFYDHVIRSHQYKQRHYWNILNHEYIFWFGDLGTHILGWENAKTIRHMLNNGHLHDLFVTDQLYQVLTEGPEYEGFQEGPIDFPPTHKYSLSSSTLDLTTRPAWADRILYRVKGKLPPGLRLKMHVLGYQYYPEYMMSQHKPVSGTFLMHIVSKRYTDQELTVATHGRKPVRFFSKYQ